ncbi:MAG: hypothetical protein RL254_1698, partial [Planctomycetota bacterium]
MTSKRPMTPHADALEEYLLNLTRRRFFGTVASTIGAGLGGAALASLLGRNAAAGDNRLVGADGKALPNAAPT